VFRNVRSAVYLRTNERNRANLERAADYYARQEVPFDASRGFDPERVIREARNWAVMHGLIPPYFEDLVAVSRGLEPARRELALDHLASLYAALGLYERATRLDRRLLRSEPDLVAPRRRTVWCLLRLDRISEALEAAESLAAAPSAGALSHAIAAAARDSATLADAGDAIARISRLPVFTPAEAARLASGIVLPEARTSRR
jgi:tetratricopeptide (TPR) repeat protein